MKKLLSLASAMLLGLCLNAQQDTLPRQPMHLSLFTPLSTNGMESYSTVNEFSISLFYSGSAGVDGVELGAFANYTRYFVQGVQLAGFANITGGQVQGIQGAGFANIVDDQVHGIQLAGFSNFSSSLEGSQLAGFGNIVYHSVEGIQMAGFGNIAGTSLEGLQMAGFVNIASESEGTQLAGFSNISGDVEGAQIAGFLNIARNLDGLQLGLLNFSDSVASGIPVGFLSFVKKNGYQKLDLWADELFYTNLGFKTGVKRLYNIIAIGTRFETSPYTFSATYGLGSEISLSPRWSVNPELLFQQFYGNDFRQRGYWSFAPQFRPLLKYQLTHGIGLYAGPTIRIIWQNEDVDYFPSQLQSWVISQDIEGHYIRRFWIGVAAGLSLF